MWLKRVFPGWWMVTIALFIFTVTSSTASHGLGTYVVVLERQFGWSRTVLSGAFSVSRIQMAAFGPISGLLIDRFGPKRLMTLGFIIMAAGFFAFSFTSSPWHFYLSFFSVSNYVNQHLIHIMPRLGAHSWLPRTPSVEQGQPPPAPEEKFM